MRPFFGVITVLLLLAFRPVFANSTESYGSDTTQIETARALQKMKPSMKGKTIKGNSYAMYSIKVKKDWVFLVLDTLGINSMKFDEVNDQLVEMDKSFTEVLCLAAKSNSLRKKEKVRVIAGTELECYYKMQGKAAKTYKSMKKMNSKAKDIMSRTRKEYRSTKRGISKAKSAKGKLKRAKSSKGKSLL
jgi:hypothetical protein